MWHSPSRHSERARHTPLLELPYKTNNTHATRIVTDVSELRKGRGPADDENSPSPWPALAFLATGHPAAPSGIPESR